jgi:hypothetical protein
VVGKIMQWVPIDGTRWRNEVANGTKIMKWVCITALLLAVTWRPAENYQMQLDFVVCGGALVGVLALFFIRHEIETHTDPTPRGESL